jgi:hypothetical protein
MYKVKHRALIIILLPMAYDVQETVVRLRAVTKRGHDSSNEKFREYVVGTGPA